MHLISPTQYTAEIQDFSDLGNFGKRLNLAFNFPESKVDTITLFKIKDSSQSYSNAPDFKNRNGAFHFSFSGNFKFSNKIIYDNKKLRVTLTRKS